MSAETNRSALTEWLSRLDSSLMFRRFSSFPQVLQPPPPIAPDRAPCWLLYTRREETKETATRPCWALLWWISCCRVLRAEPLIFHSGMSELKDASRRPADWIKHLYNRKIISWRILGWLREYMNGSTHAAVLANKAGSIELSGVKRSVWPEMPSREIREYGVHAIIQLRTNPATIFAIAISTLGWLIPV